VSFFLVAFKSKLVGVLVQIECSFLKQCYIHHVVHAVNSKQKTKKFPEQFPLYETPCSIIRVISHLRNNGGNLEFIFHKIIFILRFIANAKMFMYFVSAHQYIFFLCLNITGLAKNSKIKNFPVIAILIY
jgi:hypothetical protein